MTNQEISRIRQELSQFSHPEKIAFLKNYMSTPYSFIYGIKVPDSRKIAKKFKNTSFYDMLNLFDELWKSGNHEEMSLGIHILQVNKKKLNHEFWNFFKPRLEKIKTWDHADWVATDILSQLLLDNIIKNSEIKALAQSKNHWMRRLAIESTYKLIKKNKLELTFLLAENLVYDEDKFVQKGVGWMLREAGKKNRFAVRDFIIRHIKMKPVAFSYATEKMKELRDIRKEKLSENKEKAYFIIIRGPAGVGKTTIAKRVAEELRAIYISVDKLLEIRGLDKIQGGCITKENFLEINEIIIPKVIEYLKNGKTVVFDGNFYHKAQLSDLTKKLKFKHFIFTLKADLEECLSRHNQDKTRKISEKDIKDVYNLVSKFDAGIIIDTNNKSVEEINEELINKINPKE